MSQLIDRQALLDRGYRPLRLAEEAEYAAQTDVWFQPNSEVLQTLHISDFGGRLDTPYWFISAYQEQAKIATRIFIGSPRDCTCLLVGNFFAAEEAAEKALYVHPITTGEPLTWEELVTIAEAWKFGEPAPLVYQWDCNNNYFATNIVNRGQLAFEAGIKLFRTELDAQVWANNFTVNVLGEIPF